MKQTSEKLNKVDDKAFSRLVFTSVLAILCCMACICSATWAWFTTSIPSENNSIKSARECLIQITVEKDGAIVGTANIGNNVVLNESGTYTVTLSLEKDSASGYAIITSGTDNYYTEYIKAHNDDTAQTKTFELVIPDGADMPVTIVARWGVFSCETDVVGGKINIQ